MESSEDVDSDIERVKRAYDKAIQSAREREVISTQAFANKLALKYCLSIGDYEYVPLHFPFQILFSFTLFFPVYILSPFAVFS